MSSTSLAPAAWFPVDSFLADPSSFCRALTRVLVGSGQGLDCRGQTLLVFVTNPEMQGAESRRARECVSKIEVRALEPALHVLIDGQPYSGAWYSSLDLFLYLVHHPQGGTGFEIATALWTESTMSDRRLQQRFQSRLAFLRRILGTEAIIREGSARPGQYRLNPSIVVDYDVRRFEDAARDILCSEPAAGQLPALEAARAIRAEPYWPARLFWADWCQTIHDGVERLYFRLLKRELRLARAAGLASAGALEKLCEELTERTGIGLRENLEHELLATP